MKGKGNDGKGNNESRDMWQTDQDFWNVLNKQYNFTCHRYCYYFAGEFNNK